MLDRDNLFEGGGRLTRPIIYLPWGVVDFMTFLGAESIEDPRGGEKLFTSQRVFSEEVDNIRRKIASAYPETFPEGLRKKSIYFPLAHEKPLPDKLLREQIVGDSHMRLEDELKLAKAVNPKDGETILDLGAGFGRMSILLAEQAKIKVLAVDKDEEKIALLKEVLPKYRFNDGTLGIDRITPILASVSKLSPKILGGIKADTVLIKNVLGLLSSIEKPKLGIEELGMGGLCKAVKRKSEQIVSQVKKIIKENGKVVVWDGDLSNSSMLHLLDYVMYFGGFISKETSILIDYQGGNPPSPFKATFGVYSYNPKECKYNDSFHRKNLEKQFKEAGYWVKFRCSPKFRQLELVFFKNSIGL